jgi:lactate dehydrogenase-like 2-hydroxyacid dehydrogenase
MSWRVSITARTLKEMGAGALKLLQTSGCEFIIPPNYGPYRPETLIPLLEEADAVLANMDHFHGYVLECQKARSLKIISRWGVGYDAIDVPTATRQGIVVAYTPGLLNEAVADLESGLLLAVARGIHLGHLHMSQGDAEGARKRLTEGFQFIAVASEAGFLPSKAQEVLHTLGISGAGPIAKY